MKLALVLGTSTGGTARHVRMLAAGCAARGVRVEVFGPAQTDRDFAFGGAAPGVFVNAVAHQSVSGVQQALDLGRAVLFLALHDVVAGKFQIIQNSVGVGPLLEHVIVFEKVIMPERRVRDHQRLHRGGVFLHDVADARVGEIGRAHV